MSNILATLTDEQGRRVELVSEQEDGHVFLTIRDWAHGGERGSYVLDGSLSDFQDAVADLQ